MAAWQCTTALEVADIAQCARDGVLSNINRLKARNVRKGLSWGPASPVAGGVFDSFAEQPSWSAKAEYTPPNGRGGAEVSITIYDRTDHRLVTIEIANSIGFGSLSKALASGIIVSLNAADPDLSAVG
jgi:hypothetical protein